MSNTAPGISLMMTLTPLTFPIQTAAALTNGGNIKPSVPATGSKRVSLGSLIHQQR
jgi:hypothetical protein